VQVLEGRRAGVLRASDERLEAVDGDGVHRQAQGARPQAGEAAERHREVLEPRVVQRAGGGVERKGGERGAHRRVRHGADGHEDVLPGVRSLPGAEADVGQERERRRPDAFGERVALAPVVEAYVRGLHPV
jgi:hypothetical protein